MHRSRGGGYRSVSAAGLLQSGCMPHVVYIETSYTRPTIVNIDESRNRLRLFDQVFLRHHNARSICEGLAVPHLSAPIQFLQHLWFAMIATRGSDIRAWSKLLELLEIARIARNWYCYEHGRNCYKQVQLHITVTGN